jgi:hypothetical protein
MLSYVYLSITALLTVEFHPEFFIRKCAIPMSIPSPPDPFLIVSSQNVDSTTPIFENYKLDKTSTTWVGF